jgi:hypothetical protein
VTLLFIGLLLFFGSHWGFERAYRMRVTFRMISIEKEPRPHVMGVSALRHAGRRWCRHRASGPPSRYPYLASEGAGCAFPGHTPPLFIRAPLVVLSISTAQLDAIGFSPNRKSRVERLVPGRICPTNIDTIGKWIQVRHKPQSLESHTMQFRDHPDDPLAAPDLGFL